ncbi:putative cell wall hydrolase LytN [Mammaliicoccus sciuri]|nr:hypothetical protein B5723_03730 [Mammaliicoccus sciuri]CAG7914441.1 putative cell wall hydrolase LytN [Mammaliicoccus sciuri]SFV43665.1 Hypothetical protein SSCIU_00454 [Mammaliicoccus sciuri]SQE51296.1 CHAP domain-containing protein [Mammaliicoccus sciuri]
MKTKIFSFIFVILLSSSTLFEVNAAEIPVQNNDNSNLSTRFYVDTYASGTSKTKNQAIGYINSLEGKGWDFDGYYGWQCFDLVNYYWNYLYGHGLKGAYAKDIPFENNFNGEATVYKNTPSFIAQPGDLAVFNSNYGQGAGHTSIVTNGNIDGNLLKFQSLDQNWYGGGLNKTEVAQRVNHNYDTEMWFIRPTFNNNSTSGWQQNQYGTWFKSESATFTSNTLIIKRYDGPFRSMPQAGSITSGQSVKYDEVCLQDGHVWVGYTDSKGKRTYIPIRTWNGVNPPNHGVGSLWGTIK